MQTWLGHQAAGWLTEQLGQQVTIGSIRVGYRFDIQLNDVVVPDKTGDAFIAFKKLTVVPSRFQPARHRIRLASVMLDSARVNIVKYAGDTSFNYSALVNLLGTAGTTPVAESKTTPWRLHCGHLDLSRVHFTYLNQNKPRDLQGMDYHFIDVNDIALQAEAVTMIADSFDFVLNKLTGKERSGLILKDLTGHFRLSSTTLQGFDTRLLTPRSDLDCDFAFKYNTWQDYEMFIDSINIEAFVRWSALNLAELAPFSTSLLGMDNAVRFGGVVNGKVSNLKSDQFTFTFGDESRFDGAVQLVGLPNVEETFIRLKVKDFTTNTADIEGFKLGSKYGEVGDQITLPREMRRLGFLGIKGNFTGFFNDFVADASFHTALGTINTDLVLRQSKRYELEYEGNLKLDKFDVGVLTGEALFGPVTMEASLKGHGVSLDNLYLDIDGKIRQWRVKGYEYNEINISGLFDQKRFSGILGIDDPNLKLSFNGIADLSQKLPTFNFTAAISDFNPAKLGLIKTDSTMVVSAVLLTDFSGSDLDNLTGSININNLVVSNSHATYNLNSIDIRTDSLANGERLISLSSDIADGLIKGRIKFSEIGGSATLFIRNYVASFKMRDELIEKDISGQQFSYQLHILNPDAITALFFPTLKIAHNSRITGHYDAEAVEFNLQANAPAISIGGKRLEHWFLRSQTQNQRLVIETGCKRLVVKESYDSDTTLIAFDSLAFMADVANDSILFDLKWNDIDIRDLNRGDIAGYASFGRQRAVDISVTKSKLNIGGQIWMFPHNNSVTIDSLGWHFNQVGLTNGAQWLTVQGSLADDTLAQLKVNFVNFNLSNFDALLASSGVNLDGLINGEAIAFNVFDQPRVTANATVDSFGFNGYSMGTLSLNSEWIDQLQSLHIDATSLINGDNYSYHPLSIKGYYHPSSVKQNFDLKIGIENFDLKALNPLLEDNLSQISGFATAHLDLAGTQLKPDIQGSVKLMRTEFLVNYLNTRYSLADEITIEHDKIIFDNIIINDSLGHKASCTGVIRHNYLEDFELDITVRPEQFILMNTDAFQNRFFYGTAIASGPIRISGPLNNLTLNASTKLLRGTEIFLPLSMSTSIADNDFIVFLNQPHDSIEEAPIYKLNVSGFNLNFDLTLTPEARLEIALPYQSGNIECRGQGEINLTVNSKGDLGLNGEYQITSGNFLFKYKNLFSRGFEIRSGSNIRFNGSPYNAVINLTAVHHSRTTLAGLDLELDSTITRARIPVNSIIRLKNKLLNPDISFGLEFPKLDETYKQVIYAKLDTTNEVVMTQQILSLLVLNNFSFQTGNNSISNTIGISGFELLSNQVSNLLSQVSRDVDIGINYRPGDNISAQEFEVIMRTQLFDNRVTIDGNLGVTGQEGSNRTSNIVGDVNVEVKLTEDGRFKFKAFNRSNNLDQVFNNSPYTQGIGFSYRREFNKLKDIFEKRTPPPALIITDTLNVEMEDDKKLP
ncbi:MAG TPA: hypothetical protein DEO70_06030 [Bacteroidales bacterium]|nr:MAG: hypothetical protein A2X11_11510 [Bacteroidetes bacterium GWE2_42_24]OFY25535.1 MAG: hypothetical protein A2X09_07110 [Bacteroidetes bacterium GWF2_43_11]HBZ66380.1 hypothetical protein [Bacteroidales bacterium]